MLFLFLNNQTDLVITLPSLALLMSSLLYLTVGCGLTILGIHHPLLHLKPKIWKTGKKKKKRKKNSYSIAPSWAGKKHQILRCVRALITAKIDLSDNR